MQHSPQTPSPHETRCQRKRANSTPASYSQADKPPAFTLLASGENCGPAATRGLTCGVRPPRSHGVTLDESQRYPFRGRSFLPTNEGVAPQTG